MIEHHHHHVLWRARFLEHRSLPLSLALCCLFIVAFRFGVSNIIHDRQLGFLTNSVVFIALDFYQNKNKKYRSKITKLNNNNNNFIFTIQNNVPLAVRIFGFIGILQCPVFAVAKHSIECTGEGTR